MLHPLAASSHLSPQDDARKRRAFQVLAKGRPVIRRPQSGASMLRMRTVSPARTIVSPSMVCGAVDAAVPSAVSAIVAERKTAGSFMIRRIGGTIDTKSIVFSSGQILSHFCPSS